MTRMRNGHRGHGYASTVIGRAVTVLAAFTPTDSAVGSAELSRRAGLPKSTTHRLVLELVRQRLLERVEGGYRPTVRMFEFGQLAPYPRELREAALPLMTDLHHAVEQTVNLAVLQDEDVVYVEILPHSHSPRLPSRVGGRLPAHRTALGKAILAHRIDPDVAIDADDRRSNREPQVVSRDGFAYDLEKSAPGVWCLASPIFDVNKQAAAALSVSGAARRLRPDLVAERLEETAARISTALADQGA
jgi:IclR family transcriptional regulator, acetate operon repressor